MNFNFLNDLQFELIPSSDKSINVIDKVIKKL